MFDKTDELEKIIYANNAYQIGKNYFNNTNYIDELDRQNRMYIGDQWYGLDADGEDLPIYNFIKPTVRYKVAVIGQHQMSVVYSHDGQSNEQINRACELLTDYFRRMCEQTKMDFKDWQVLKKAAIEGCAFLFFPSMDLNKAQVLSGRSIIVADEQNPDLQEQKYIIIVERLPVGTIQRRAKENGLDESEILQITSDKDQDLVIGEKSEVDTDDGKCTSLLFMYKDKEGYVHYFRTTDKVMYEKDTVIQGTDEEGKPSGIGLRSYPIAPFIWEDVEGSIRGCGEVKWLINNQLELNKTLARRSLSIKQTAFARLAYVKSAVDDENTLDLTGTKIALTGNSADDVNKLIGYLKPATQSTDASNYTNELMMTTRELSGAGDIATGSVNPEKASGQAIAQAKAQSELPINEQVARYKQYKEDVARVVFDIIVAYNPNGLEVPYTDNDGNEQYTIIFAEVLEQIKPNIRVDVSNNSPYSKLAREQYLMDFFNNPNPEKSITFEELVQALDKDSNIPKDKFNDIIKKRGIQDQYKQTLIQAMELLKQTQMAQPQIGGMPNEMQTM